MLGEMNVVARQSRHEEGRSIELQILDDDGEILDFAAFSDGPSGVLGIGGVAMRDAVHLDAAKRYEDGAPVEEIDILPPTGHTESCNRR
jgi:hypothetical protein